MNNRKQTMKIAGNAIAACGLAAALGAGAGCADRAERASASQGERTAQPVATATETGATFANDAAVSNMTEIELGQIAAEKGTSDAVREYGRMMVTEHRAALDRLRDVAQDQGYMLPTSLPADRRGMITRMRALQGADFDREYMAAMVNSHRRAIETFEKYALAPSGGRTDDAMVGYARNALPTLREHLNQATTIAERVGAAYTGGQQGTMTDTSAAARENR